MNADADEPAWPADAIEVARVLGAWGIKGGIRIKPFSGDPQALFSSKRWFVRAAERRLPGPRTNELPRLLRVIEAHEQGDNVVARVQEIDDRERAQALQGASIFVSRASFPTADEGEYYWVDLIGLDVFNRQGQALGQVFDLLETGAHCVLQVRAPDSAAANLPATLIPFVAPFIDVVDLAARRMVVDWDAQD